MGLRRFPRYSRGLRQKIHKWVQGEGEGGMGGKDGGECTTVATVAVVGASGRRFTSGLTGRGREAWGPRAV